MGFLEGLFKSAARKIVSEVADGLAEEIQNIRRSGDTAGTEAVTAAADSDEEDCCYEISVVRRRVEAVFAQEWSGYEVRRDIAAEEMGAPEGSYAYSYGLYLQGQPKAMVMILEGGAEYRRKGVVCAHKACEEKGVFCMNLLLHMPNRRSYISKRLKDNVR